MEATNSSDKEWDEVELAIIRIYLKFGGLDLISRIIRYPMETTLDHGINMVKLVANALRGINHLSGPPNVDFILSSEEEKMEQEGVILEEKEMYDIQKFKVNEIEEAFSDAMKEVGNNVEGY